MNNHLNNSWRYIEIRTKLNDTSNLFAFLSITKIETCFNLNIRTLNNGVSFNT